MTILTVGIDLAKDVFAVHGFNEAGKPELVKPIVARDKLTELMATLAPCQFTPCSIFLATGVEGPPFDN